MTRNAKKIRQRVFEAEQAADIALAAVKAETGVGQEVTSAVSSVHDWARQAKQSLDSGEGELKDLATLRGLIAAAEEASDQALEDAKTDAAVGKSTRKALQAAHDSLKKAKDLF